MGSRTDPATERGSGDCISASCAWTSGESSSKCGGFRSYRNLIVICPLLLCHSNCSINSRRLYSSHTSRVNFLNFFRSSARIEPRRNFRCSNNRASFSACCLSSIWVGIRGGRGGAAGSSSSTRRRRGIASANCVGGREACTRISRRYSRRCSMSGKVSSNLFLGIKPNHACRSFGSDLNGTSEVASNMMVSDGERSFSSADNIPRTLSGKIKGHRSKSGTYKTLGTRRLASWN